MVVDQHQMGQVCCFTALRILRVQLCIMMCIIVFFNSTNLDSGTLTANALQCFTLWQFLGAMGVMETASGLVAPLMFNALYDWTVGVFTGLVYVVASAFPLIGCALTLWCLPDAEALQRSRALVTSRVSMVL